MKIAGIILAGGQSSRYGKPKMFELFAGQPLYKHSLIALQKNQLSPIIIATNAQLQHQFEQENVQWIIDKQLHQGRTFCFTSYHDSLP
ncbi:putative molybdenum cofactor guanylyltransferase OS=Lysinibacillus sphaericus OX=1421 GN=mobA PE=3 SV=1 [Lysinibacillus sphaericus]